MYRGRGALVCLSGLSGLLIASACSSFGSAEPEANGGPGSDAGVSCAPVVDLSADCPENRLRCDPAGDCELNALTDTNNCGVCGRVCEGLCDKGTCAPSKLDDKGSTTGFARAIGADDVHGYWIADGTAWQVPLDGGGLVGQGDSIAGTNGYVDLAVDGQTFYLLSATDVTRASGGTAESLAGGITATPTGRIATDGTHVYFTEGRDPGQVGAVATDGGGGLRALATQQTRPSHLAVVDGGVVFVNQATVAPSTDGAILFATLARAGSPEEKIRDLPQIGDLVASDGVGYFTLLDQGEIWSFDLSTFEMSQVVGGLEATEHLAVDATDLYFTGKPTADAAYGIYRVGRCGGEVKTVTTNTGGNATGIALHDRFVYWSAGGAFYRTSK
jgi:hypothetical protein